MPSRMLKESVRTSRNVNSLSDFEFRVWVHLITYVDDFGRGSADPELLLGLLFPRRHDLHEDALQKALVTLAEKGMITLYENDGEPYFFFPKWGTHQRIRQKVSKFPEPPASCGDPQRTAARGGEMRPEENVNRREEETEIEEETEEEARSECEERKQTHSPEDDGFDAFWSAYPRKSGDIRGAYMEYIHALDTGVSPRTLMAALRWQSEEWHREGTPQFIPSPEKWLKNRRWEERPRDTSSGTNNLFLQIIEEGKINDTR